MRPSRTPLGWLGAGLLAALLMACAPGARQEAGGGAGGPQGTVAVAGSQEGSEVPASRPRPPEAPDVVVFHFSGKCSGLCEQPDDNDDALAHDSMPALQADLEAAGLSVRVFSYRAHLHDDPVRGHGFLRALTDLDRVHAAWVDGVGLPTRLVLVAHSHGTQYAHLLAMERPRVAFAASVAFDSVCFSFDQHHAEAYLRELRGGQGMQADPVTLGCKVLRVPGRGAMDVGDVVPINVAEALEVWSLGVRESGLVRDVTPNARPDGGEEGLARFRSLDDGHSAVARPGSAGFAHALDWLRGVLLR